MDVYLEIGTKRVFAAAVDWPGWCRAGKDEDSALQSLVDYAPRYARAVANSAEALRRPARVGQLSVVERVTGGSGTDFGVPGSVPDLDRPAPDAVELDRLIEIHATCWAAFELAARNAAGRTLRTGPRGGGRDLSKIRAHVVAAEAAYVRALGGEAGDATSEDQLPAAFAAAVRARAAGGLPDRGPRGGERWPPRYAVRRSAWHLLDHAWEIEDRLTPR